MESSVFSLLDNSRLLFSILSFIFVSVGSMKIFIKCGVEPFWAFIPFAREYHTSICADDEPDGRTYAIVTALVGLLYFPLYLYTETSEITIVGFSIVVIYLVLKLTQIIYLIRIYLNLTKIFGRKKKWVFMFALFEGITCMIWGFNNNFQPEKKYDAISKSSGAKVAGIKAKSIDTGLTVNIENRTVIDFFKKKILLKDIHLNIPTGHMVLLLGGSGAGKTTFLNAVTGYEKANANISLNGNDLYKDYEKVKYDIGFVPQQDLMRGNDTVMLTLSDAASLKLPATMSLDAGINRLYSVLEDFGLSAIKHSLVEKLSGGQRKRLSIAMEYISDPTLFILDEPDSGLDGVVARNLFEKLREIADSGKIVIVITHTPDRVIDLFDDVIVLAKDSSRTGRLAYYGPVNDAYSFFEKDTMEKILLSINQKDEGGEGRADEFVEKYAEQLLGKAQ